MTNLQLGLTLSVVGPRADLLAMDEWPMALRITVGTDSEPPKDQQHATLTRTLPWVLWPDLSGARVKVAIRTTPGSAAVVEPATVIEPLVEDADFLKNLKTKVEEEGTRLVDQELLKFTFQPGDVVDEDDLARTGIGPAQPEKREPVPWPGLLATLQSLAAPTPSALHCTWYFVLPKRLLAEEKDGVWTVKDIFISAAPASVGGVDHDDSDVGSIVNPDRYPVHVHKYVSSGIVGHCESLKLKSVLDHEVDEMDNFWLAIRDSGDESLLDLGPRLDAACQPAAALSVLSIEEMTSAMVADVTNPPDPNPVDKRAPTPPEAAAAMEAWKRLLANGKAADTRARVLRAAATARQGQADAARAELRNVALEVLSGLTPQVVGSPSATTRVTVSFFGDSDLKDKLAATAEARLFPREARAPTAPSAADGIDLIVGDPSVRLRHITTDENNAIDDVAQIQLFARRSSDISQLDAQAADAGAQWHSLSAARYQLADDRSTERLLGMTASYVDDVLCRELTYAGANIACEHALAGVHRESLDDDPLTDQSFMLAAPRSVACTDGALRTLPLRYGDFYEFAAAVRDRAGGMAKELTGKYPWQANLAKIPSMDPPQRDRVHYVRRSAVGDCNIGPGAQTTWPQTPADVALRCLEGLVTEPGKPAPSVVFLVPQDSARFKAPRASYTFRVQAPRASEHVLLRWNMPATTLAQSAREAAVEELKKDLIAIFTKRDEMVQTIGTETSSRHQLAPRVVPEILPVDPAVTRVGLRWRFASGLEGVGTFDRGVIEMTVSAGEKSERHSDVAFTVGEGDFLRLTFHALVSVEDTLRFDPRTLDAHLFQEEGALKPMWPGYRAFEGSDVYVETAASVFPVPDMKRLSLAEDAQGHVAVTYDFSSSERSFAHVDQIYVESERWVWRNLPIPPEKSHPGGADRVRRLASGPPLDLMDPKRRDQSDAVDQFDRLSEIDNGFVGRKDQVVAYPRDAKGSVLLKVDARDEHAHADYLRYSVAFRSRYAAVLEEPLSTGSGQRRIATRFRGDTSRVKPPRVLAILPLTQGMPAPGATGEDGSPPFLVVVDETWFREYGIGERLAARVARVKSEIPETPDNPPQEFRYGPLPDHRLDAPAEDALKGKELLEVFGPFGLSHERGGSQALANATAFVVYPPKGTPPHFNLFAEFSRVLDLPSERAGKALESEYTEAVALYTLPDMAQIALGGKAEERLHLKAAGKGFECTGARKLAPFPGARGDVLLRYRYVLVVGHRVRDGGRAVDVFLPADAMWLSPSSAVDKIVCNWLDGEAHDVKKLGYNAAVVLEVLLNGQFADEHPLRSAKNLRRLFEMMLDDGPKASGDGKTVSEIGDAPGMIRRVSEWFEVAFEGS